ncbi:MAG TPA: hypothetical protein VFN10_05100, partial [Thermoanaerobaculia bacterium]|nr:hypothetical protein [Thermoanaerobaculia bacterium]
EELQAQVSTPAPEPEASSPWDEQPAFGGETRAFPKMSFDEMQQMASGSAAPSAPEPEPAPWGEPEPEPAAPSWSPTADTSSIDTSASSESFATEAASPFAESMESEAPAISPFAADDSESEPETLQASEPAPEIPAAEPLWSPAAAEPDAQHEPEPMVGSMPPAAVAAAQAFDLNEEMIDRIARRVVQLMSDQVVRNIAWEVIPDLAEVVVKERIRQLENE